jgi:hypothetical protein
MSRAKRLFVGSGERGDLFAYLGINQGDMARRLYCSGFFEAARCLLDEAARNHLPVDTCFYPAMFLFRHALEVALKEMYASLWFLNRRDGQPPQRHSLKQVWESLRPDLEYFFNVYPDDQTADGCPVQQVPLDEVQAAIDELQELDPNGQAFRYPVSTTGTPTLEHVQYVNLRHLLEATTRIGEAVNRWQRKLNDQFLHERHLSFVAGAARAK